MCTLNTVRNHQKGMKMTNNEKYERCFMEMFQVSQCELAKLKYQSIQAWDSVGHMNLMGVIEEEFEIEMEIDDITDFSSFDKGKDILGRYEVNIDE